MLLDANILLYAVDRRSAHHERAAEWLEAALNGGRLVGLPWQTIGAFVRIITHPRVSTTPLDAATAWGHVQSWLDADPTWIPSATERTAGVFAELTATHAITADLVPDAMLCALALEHGLAVVTADTDFARFPEIRWTNPLSD
ncbi:MAG: TA system VapC family ribonuclease toxin [Acidimicrobiales bacterium]